jgi:hypothetical protein
MNPASLSDLLETAAVPDEKRDDAAYLLGYWLSPIKMGPSTTKSRARSLYDAAQHQGSSKDHNDPLEKIEAAAEKLILALERLRSRPYAHSEFWLNHHFGPVTANELERPAILDAIARVGAAAQTSRLKQVGRTLDEGKQRIVDQALAFFLDFSPLSPSADENNKFRDFAHAYYEAAVGRIPRGAKEFLTYQIRAALNKSR